MRASLVNESQSFLNVRSSPPEQLELVPSSAWAIVRVPKDTNVAQTDVGELVNPSLGFVNVEKHVRCLEVARECVRGTLSRVGSPPLAPPMLVSVLPWQLVLLVSASMNATVISLVLGMKSAVRMVAAAPARKH